MILICWPQLQITFTSLWTIELFGSCKWPRSEAQHSSWLCDFEVFNPTFCNLTYWITDVSGAMFVVDRGNDIIHHLLGLRGRSSTEGMKLCLLCIPSTVYRSYRTLFKRISETDNAASKWTITPFDMQGNSRLPCNERSDRDFRRRWTQNPGISWTN